jgi:hypothetical protein
VKVILVFVRYPEPGRVKTRLAATVGDAVAADIYRAFVEDLLKVCHSTSNPVTVMVSEEEDLEKTRGWLVEVLGGVFACEAQQGHDLGERMSRAFERVFERGFEQAILIGSDIPDLPADIIRKGFDALRSKDVVIGPCRDGGYYLIGFRSPGFRRAVFEGVEWSTPSVFSRTRGLVAENRLSCEILPQWDDVDTFDDLERLFDRVKTTDGAPRTLVACRKQVLREDR